MRWYPQSSEWRPCEQGLLGRLVVHASRLTMALALVGAARFDARAQGDRIIPDTPSCTRCDIRVASRIELLESDAAPFVAMPNAVRMDSRGRLWVLQPLELPQIFAPTGRFLASVGRKGAGPGEYRMPFEAFSTPGDSVVVLDAGTSRGTVLDPDLSPTRFFRMPWGAKPVIVVKWPSAILGAALIRTPAAAGLPLHRFDVSGTEMSVTASYRHDGDVLRPSESAVNYIPVIGTGGRLWTAERNRFRMTEWTTDGRVLRGITRAPAWFPTIANPGWGNRTTAPPPAIAGMALEGSDRLWVVISRPKQSWPKAWPAQSGPRGEIRTSDVRTDLLYESVLEIIDVAAGTVIARTVLPDFVIDLLPDRRAVVYSTADDGTRSLAVITLVVARR